MAPRRLSISLRRGEALKVTRVTLDGEKLVYALVQDKKQNYSTGRSRVVYIGTTKNGTDRVAQSAASWADTILRQHGVDNFAARIITCRPRQHVKTWRKLERALLLVFKEIYGEVPRCNTHGKNIVETDEFRYFARARIKRILDDLG